MALIGGEPDEERGLRQAFERVASSMLDLMRSERRLMWLTSAYGMLSTVFPALVAAPAYFAGAITLGGLMQIGSAFGQVTGLAELVRRQLPAHRRLAQRMWSGVVRELAGDAGSADAASRSSDHRGGGGAGRG